MNQVHENDPPRENAASHGSPQRDLPDEAAREELWMVQAVIQPFKLDSVTRALEGIPGFSGMTVTNVRGFGRAKLEDRTTAGRTTPAGKPPREALDDFTEKIRLDIAVCGARRANDLAVVIAREAHTGNRGDGKIFLWRLSRVIHVRTREEGYDAL